MLVFSNALTLARPNLLGAAYLALAALLGACGSEPSTAEFPSGDLVLLADVQALPDVVAVEVAEETSSSEVTRDTQIEDAPIVAVDVAVEADLAGSTDASGDADDTVAAPSLADFIRETGAVISSSRVQAQPNGQTLCTDATGASCLATKCEFTGGCMYLAIMRYTSTPTTGTSGPALKVHALYGQVAPIDALPGHAPVLILNHGGTTLDVGTINVGVLAADMGYAVMMPSYRGANESDGEVEGCLGEVDDVRILTDLVHDKAPDDPIFMMGGSHGGCVTLGAIQAGAPVKAAVALWPGTDSARRFRYNRGSVLDVAPLSVARAACAGMPSACCDRVRKDYNFVANVLIADAVKELGDLPDWSSVPYACDSRTYVASPSPWVGREAQKEGYCSRSPLARAETLANSSIESLLIIHGERDPYISVQESCEYARQAGGFSVRRIGDVGIYSARAARTACRGMDTTAAEPDSAWTGARHLVLVSPLGHGDVGRSSTWDACDSTPVASPDLDAIMFGFLAAKQ